MKAKEIRHQVDSGGLTKTMNEKRRGRNCINLATSYR